MDLRIAVFSIRIWRERSASDAKRRHWRAQVRDCGSKASVHAETDEAIIAFMRRWRDRHLFGIEPGEGREEDRRDD